MKKLNTLNNKFTKVNGKQGNSLNTTNSTLHPLIWPRGRNKSFKQSHSPNPNHFANAFNCHGATLPSDVVTLWPPDKAKLYIYTVLS